LVLLISADLDRPRLIRDIRDTFDRRKTHDIPAVLEAPPEFWRPTFERMAAECGIEPDIEMQFRKFQAFIAEIGLH
jgi:hypothetical protein